MRRVERAGRHLRRIPNGSARLRRRARRRFPRTSALTPIDCQSATAARGAEETHSALANSVLAGQRSNALKAKSAAASIESITAACSSVRHSPRARSLRTWASFGETVLAKRTSTASRSSAVPSGSSIRSAMSELAAGCSRAEHVGPIVAAPFHQLLFRRRRSKMVRTVVSGRRTRELIGHLAARQGLSHGVPQDVHHLALKCPESVHAATNL